MNGLCGQVGPRALVAVATVDVRRSRCLDVAVVAGAAGGDDGCADEQDDSGASDRGHGVSFAVRAWLMTVTSASATSPRRASSISITASKRLSANPAWLPRATR